MNIKIVSDGQTGVDQGSLEAAALLGLEYGGWAPHGWLAEKPLGAIPEAYRAAMRKLNGKALEKAVEKSEPGMDSGANIFRTIALGCGEIVELTGPDITGALGDPDYFNPLLEALPHVRMAEGWRLDAAYSGSHMGGKLAFFATDGKSREDFLQHVEPDGSPESVWELRLLIIATDVFHLVWHANYGNMCIVTSYDRLKRDARRIECDIDAVLEELEPKERSRLESWDMTPSISATGRALGPFASPPSPRRRNRSWRSGRGRVCDSKTAFANRQFRPIRSRR